MVYFISFIFSAFLLDVSAHTRKNMIKKTLFVFSVAIPIMLATYRSLRVGTDVRVYVYPYANWAINNSFIEYLRLALNDAIEPGYILVNYFGANYFGGIAGVFLLTELIIIVPVYRQFLKSKDETPVWLCVMIYLLLFYNMGLNLVRQTMALSIIFTAYSHLKSNEYKKYVFLVILATMFHYSALLALSLLLFDLISKGKGWEIKQIIIFLCLVISIWFYNDIFAFIIKIFFSFNPDKYLSAFLNNETGYLSSWNILFNGIFVLTVIFNKKKLIKEGEYKRNLLIAVFTFMLYILTFYNGNCFRYSLYFAIFIPSIVPKIRSKFTYKSRLGIDVAVLAAYVFYWFNFNIIIDSYGTLPYEILS